MAANVIERIKVDFHETQIQWQYVNYNTTEGF